MHSNSVAEVRKRVVRVACLAALSSILSACSRELPTEGHLFGVRLFDPNRIAVTVSDTVVRAGATVEITATAYPTRAGTGIFYLGFSCPGRYYPELLDPEPGQRMDTHGGVAAIPQRLTYEGGVPLTQRYSLQFPLSPLGKYWYYHIECGMDSIADSTGRMLWVQSPEAFAMSPDRRGWSLYATGISGRIVVLP